MSGIYVPEIKKVGVTGGIGSGKSTACSIFASLGIPVYDSDSRARAITDSHDGVRRALVELLGPDAYRDGTLDRAFVAAKVFADKPLLASLNAVIHPAVADDFERWAATFRATRTGTAQREGMQTPDAPPYLILESAILFESGFDALVDVTVAIAAPEEMRIERVVSRCNTSVQQQVAPTRSDVISRMGNQMTDVQRAARADYVIDNSGGLKDLTARIKELDNKLRQ